MRAFHRSRFRLVFIAVLAVSWPAAAGAQTPDQAAAQALRQEMEALRADFQARMAAVESRLATITGGEAPVAAPAAAPADQVPAPAGQATAGVDGGQPGTLPVYGGAAASSSKVFNPDMAVIGNFLGASGTNS